MTSAEDEPPPAPDPTSAPLSKLRGAPMAGAAPRMETVRVTAPDLERRAALKRTHGRLVATSFGFAALFASVVVKLALATMIVPKAPPPAEARRILAPSIASTLTDPAKFATIADEPDTHALRASITDRNGQVLALSLPTAALYANPKEIVDTADAARQLKRALPRLDEKEIEDRLNGGKQFVYIERMITPAEERVINAMGIPGVYFQATEKRRYPLGRVAAQVLGGVDVDSHGVAGVERAFDARLRNDPTPLRLSLDLRVQAALRDELQASKDEFQAIGACGIVMDVRTGEVIAMVSLPDYDANDFGDTPPEDRFNRAITGMYEPGSTFKLQTASMALDYGTAHLSDVFDAAHDIHIGRFTITDFQGKHRGLTLPEVLAYSSNLGAAHIAMTVGAERQRAWLKRMGMFRRVGIELPEAGVPIVPSEERWGESTVMTVGFGHGIAVSPLHVVRGTAAIANGGIVLQPTILARDPDQALPRGERVMEQLTSDVARRLMRLVVTDGYGKPADVPGYFVGGKTGTAEKVGGHVYKKHANVSAFMSVFPMNNPRYAVYFMLDEPHGNASTGGYSTAGAVSAPGAGRVIARIAPMLGLFPDTAREAEIQAALSIPLDPPRGWAPRPSGLFAEAVAAEQPASPAPPEPTPPEPTPAEAPQPAVRGTSAPSPTRGGPTARRDAESLRHEAALPAPVGARLLPMAAVAPRVGGGIATR